MSKCLILVQIYRETIQNFQKQPPELLYEKKMLFKISQNSQESTCARFSFLTNSSTCNFIETETLAQAFPSEFCEIFKNNLFTELFWETVFWFYNFRGFVGFYFVCFKIGLKWVKDTINLFQLFVEKRQFFSQNNPWLNNIIYH